MYVYIKFGSDVKIVSNVTIDCGRGPVIDGNRILDSPRKEDSSFTSKGAIDAISWFKALAMEAVYIDCGGRDAKWCPKSVTIPESESHGSSPPHSPVRLRRQPRKKLVEMMEADARANAKPFMPESARPLFSEHPGVLDFNPIIDEMFEQAEEVFCNWDTLSIQGQLNKQIAKLLHCYVFPAVVFEREDIPALQECKRLIAIKQEEIEKGIVNNEKKVGITEKYLNRHKEVLLTDEGLTMQSYLQGCKMEFVETFYMHVTKDIQNNNMKLDIQQMKINDLKKKVSQDLKGPQQETLAALKRERDALHEGMQKLLSVREAVRNYLYRPFIQKKKKKRRQNKVKVDDKMVGMQLSFLEGHKILVQDKDELKRLCLRKLHTVAMREAVHSNIQSLQHQNPRSVGDFSEFSVYFGGGSANEESRRQWSSMQARVDNWMSTDNKLHKFHLDGCQLIKDLAEGMLCDRQIPLLGLDISQIDLNVVSGNSEGTELLNLLSSSGHGGSAPHVGGTGDDGEDSFTKRAPMVQIIRDHVVKHTWDMAQRIVDQIAFDLPPGTRHVNRAWVCYGPHFWKEVGSAVEKVYAHFHAPQARQVHACTSSAALADIMDSKMFLDLFLNRKSDELGSFEDISEAETRVPSVDTKSAVSLDLQRCSVKDLYALANRDGAKLMGQMVDLESVKRSVSSLSMDSDPNNAESGTGTSSPLRVAQPQSQSSTSSEDSGASIHSDDLFDSEPNPDLEGPQPLTESLSLSSNSSSTVSSVMTLFESLVEPYHEKVRQVLVAGDVMEKLRAVWQSLDLLSRKTGEVCKARGMDTLLPVSIFATASFSEDLFVDYYVQLLILIDLKPSFAEHCMYDFSLTNAFSTFMYLFEARFNNVAMSGTR